jgi:hypothetical protein
VTVNEGPNLTYLTHELGRFDLSTSGDDLGLTSTLALGGHGEGVLELAGENEVLDEHRFDLNTPSVSYLLNDLTNRQRNLLATLDHILKYTRTNNMAKCRLCTLNKRLANIANAEGGLMWRCNAVVDNRREIERDVVLGHADLLGDLDDLDLDVDLHKVLGERVDVDQARVDSALKATKLGHKTNISLRHWLVGVGADNAARDCAHGTDAATEGVDLYIVSKCP